MKKINKTGLYVLAFFLMFVCFMIWYFVICDSHSMAPSDFALVSLGVVCAVECIVGAWIQTHPDGKDLSDKDRDYIEFVAECVGKILDVESPNLKSAEKGYSIEEDDNNADSVG